MTAGPPTRYRFGQFELQPDERRLLADGKPVRLGGHAFDLLVELVERGGSLVTKDRLLERVWPKVIVEENTLQTHVSALRKVLGAPAIATISGRGYRFTLEVKRVDPEPASAPALPAHNLPHSLSNFIGREKQLKELSLALDRTRLLTLTGPGGCGKTRLAIQVAANAVAKYRDGAWMVELAPLSDPGLVPQTVANVLKLKEQRDKELAQTVAGYLQGRQTLLILDNAEHVLDACAQLIDAVLRASAQVVVLVTSRERLGIAGELTYPVPSLSVPDPRDVTRERITPYESVRLFVDRARMQRPHFAVTAENAAVLASICRRLEGIPLAIELAAPRLRAMSPEELDRRLGQRFSLLRSGSRTAQPHHRTLRALIDWSYDLLGDADKAMLRRVSIFAGGWTLEAAEQVCSGDDVDVEQVLELLTSLVDKSLALAEEDGGMMRFGMLDTIRQYARDELRERGEEDRLARRHFDCYAALVNEGLAKFKGPDQQSALDHLETEHDNVRSALSWCLAPGADVVGGLRLMGPLAWFWSVRGHLREGRDWLQKVLSAAAGEPPGSHRARALVGLGVILAQLGDEAAAKTHHERGLATYRAVGDRSGTSYALRSLSNIAFAAGDYARARSLLEESLVIARELDERHAIASVLGALGEAAGKQGDYAAACSLLEECLAMVREMGDPWTTGWTLARLGEVVHAQHHHARARKLLQEGLGILREARDQWGIASILEGLAGVASALDGPASAARLWGAAERLRGEIGAPMPSGDRQSYDAKVASARAALRDDTAFELAWEDGRGMSLDRAIALALSA